MSSSLASLPTTFPVLCITGPGGAQAWDSGVGEDKCSKPVSWILELALRQQSKASFWMPSKLCDLSGEATHSMVLTRSDTTYRTLRSGRDSLALACPVPSFPVPALAFAARWLPGHKQILVDSPHLALCCIPGRGFCLESWGRGMYKETRKGGSILRTDVWVGPLTPSVNTQLPSPGKLGHLEKFVT